MVKYSQWIKPQMSAAPNVEFVSDSKEYPLTFSYETVMVEVPEDISIHTASHMTYDTMLIVLKFKFHDHPYEFAQTVSMEVYSAAGSYNKIIDELINSAAYELAPAEERMPFIYHLKSYIKENKNHAADVFQENYEDIASASLDLPAMNEKVEFPCDCSNSTGILWTIVQHLNDKDRWSREKIADWIDELHDAGKINAEFQPWEEGENNED